MPSSPPQTPGTVSRILWHFTGGPEWDADRRKQKSSPKAHVQAYKNLKSILETKELRLGDYQEIVKVVVPERRKFNVKKRRTEVERNVRVEVSSAPICCLSDIPAPHLSYHSYRYGKFTIGFRRSSAVTHGFNPVLYTLENTGIIRSIYGGLSELDFVEPDLITNRISDLESSLQSVEAELEENGQEVGLTEVGTDVTDIQVEAEGIEVAVNRGRESLRQLLAFVKTFSAEEFSTIYCEREWRSLSPFRFSIEDVAMIVLPRKIGAHRYYDDFVTRIVPRLRIPPTIPVVPWEDLVEH